MVIDSGRNSGAFLSVLDMLEGKNRIVMLLEAYFDESERPSGLLCVAGYAFAVPQARKFTKDWSRLFSDYGGFHMNEFAHRRKGFAGMSDNEHARLMREAVRIINARMTAGVAVSCRLSEMQALSPAWIRGFGHAYPVCCHWAMNALCLVLRSEGISDSIAYFFEKGHPHEAEARDFVKTASLSPELKKMYRHESDHFIPKSDAVALQAADLLAWEWVKFKDETLDQNLRRLRKSLRALFEYAPKRYKVAHCGGASLAKAMAKTRHLFYEQIEEEGLEK